MKKYLLLAFLCLFAPLLLHAQNGYVTVQSNSLWDSGLNKISNAQICFAPVNISGQPIGYRINGSGGGAGFGQSITTAVCSSVSDGAFSMRIADVSATYPLNVCFNVTVTDNTTGNELLPAGYGCVQPEWNTSQPDNWCSAGICNFDLYLPNSNAPPIVSADNLSIGSVTGGANPYASIGGTPPNQTLNLVLPYGQSPTLQIGTVTTGGPSATLTGTALEPVLNMQLPAGAVNAMPYGGGAFTGPITAPEINNHLDAVQTGDAASAIDTSLALVATGGQIVDASGQTGTLTWNSTVVITQPGTFLKLGCAVYQGGSNLTSSIAVTSSSATNNQVTLVGTLEGGEVPTVGAFLKVSSTTNDSGDFNTATAVPITSVSVSGETVTLSYYLSTANVASASDSGTVIASNPMLAIKANDVTVEGCGGGSGSSGGTVFEPSESASGIYAGQPSVSTSTYLLSLILRDLTVSAPSSSSPTYGLYLQNVTSMEVDDVNVLQNGLGAYSYILEGVEQGEIHASTIQNAVTTNVDWRVYTYGGTSRQASGNGIDFHGNTLQDDVGGAWNMIYELNCCDDIENTNNHYVASANAHGNLLINSLGNTSGLTENAVFADEHLELDNSTNTTNCWNVEINGASGVVIRDSLWATCPENGSSQYPNLWVTGGAQNTEIIGNELNGYIQQDAGVLWSVFRDNKTNSGGTNVVDNGTGSTFDNNQSRWANQPNSVVASANNTSGDIELFIPEPGSSSPYSPSGTNWGITVQGRPSSANYSTYLRFEGTDASWQDVLQCNGSTATCGFSGSIGGSDYFSWTSSALSIALPIASPLTFTSNGIHKFENGVSLYGYSDAGNTLTWDIDGQDGSAYLEGLQLWNGTLFASGNTYVNLSAAPSQPSTCPVGALWTNPSAASASTVLYVCYPANTWNAVTVP